MSDGEAELPSSRFYMGHSGGPAFLLTLVFLSHLTWWLCPCRAPGGRELGTRLYAQGALATVMAEREQDADSVDANPAQFVAGPIRSRTTREDRDDRKGVRARLGTRLMKRSHTSNTQRTSARA